MVNIASALLVLFPNSVPLVDWVVTQTAQGESITFWSGTLGPQPDALTLAAVTQAQVDAALKTRFRNQASAQYSIGEVSIGTLRGAVLVLVDEINFLRDQDAARAAAVQAAISLADLKTRWAAIPNLPDRTGLQAKNAIQNKINSGLAD